jgi:hypothetical protein
MPSSQSDYILRLIEEIGAALRRLRERLARGVPVAPDVVDEAERLQAQLFGPLWPTLRMVDSATAAGLVPDHRRLELWLELLHLQADATRLAGDHGAALSLARRAAELAHELERREGPSPPTRR